MGVCMRRFLFVVLLASGCGVDRALPFVEPWKPVPIEGDAPCGSSIVCSGERCLAGAEPAAACDANGEGAIRCFSGGFADWDGDPATGCEVNTAGGLSNCGACWHACETGQRCEGSVCR